MPRVKEPFPHPCPFISKNKRPDCHAPFRVSQPSQVQALGTKIRQHPLPFNPFPWAHLAVGQLTRSPRHSNLSHFRLRRFPGCLISSRGSTVNRADSYNITTLYSPGALLSSKFGLLAPPLRHGGDPQPSACTLCGQRCFLKEQGMALMRTSPEQKGLSVWAQADFLLGPRDSTCPTLSSPALSSFPSPTRKPG